MLQKIDEVRYNVVLMDVRMPVMDGLEATKAIRALEDPRLANIPILGISANAFVEDRQMALSAGMNEYILKPVDAKQLEAAIAKYIK